MTDLITFPIRYDPASPMRCPDFWHGCLALRQQITDKTELDEDAITRLKAIIEALGSGVPLDDIPDYHRWRAYELRRPNGLGD